MTMTKRVIIDSSAASPFRVSVAGVDAALAEFNDLIFDGNQSPLRLWGSGYVMAVGVSWNEHLGGQNASESSPIGGFSTPAGTTAVFITMWRKDDGLNRVVVPSFQPSNNGVVGGGGGGICVGSFIGVCFNTGAPGAPDTRPPSNFCNYLIFKNYN